jgi:ribose 5-phosphate isomerase B
MKIAVGNDPNASAMKNILVDTLRAAGHEVVEYGGEDPIYAHTARAVARAVASGACERGLLFCGTGLGMCLAANKVPGAYAVVCSDSYSVERSILSNNANILALGSLVHGIELAKIIVLQWLSLHYEPGGRSESKVQGIYTVEKEYIKDPFA